MEHQTTDQTTEQTTETLVGERDAAALLRVSISWLAKDRTSGRSPVVPFVKLGRTVRYSPVVLRRFVEGC
jgi:hypothetical protein